MVNIAIEMRFFIHKKRWLVLLLVAISGHLNCQKLNLQSVEHLAPPSWYVGLTEALEIILHNTDIESYNVEMKNNSQVVFLGKKSSTNKNICYLKLDLSKTTEEQILTFVCTPKINSKKKKFKPFAFEYKLSHPKQRFGNEPAFSNKDVMYLILPDRFANGNPNNDNSNIQNPDIVSRNTLKARHGGDLEGIIQNLNYIEQQGYTALWLNPVQENDQPRESYHGYAVTDHYKIDPRLGSNQDYLNLCKLAQEKGIKMVMDIMPNHFGLYHWLYQNKDTGWFNEWDSFTRTNYRCYTIYDPYAAKSEKKKNLDGWFDHLMPDVNQRNEHIRNYLDQLYLWWVCTAGLSSYRIDTYTYPNQDYMNHLCDLLLKKFPHLYIFGETWVNGTPTQVAFVRNTIKGFENNKLPGVTDFQFLWAVQNALSKNFDWTEGLNKLYHFLGEDYLYEDASRNCTFLDNHDITRYYTVCGKDLQKWKNGLIWLFTLRGVPCIYYGTEILMEGSTHPTDALVRADFPGGWKEDSVNKFLAKNRNVRETEAFEFIGKLIKLRKTQAALYNGQTVHFAGENGTYVYARVHESQTILVLNNMEKESKKINTNRFADVVKNYTEMQNMLTGEVLPIGSYFMLPAGISSIWELK